MNKVLLKQTPLQECPRGMGVWVDARLFERICAERERQADVLAMSPQEQERALTPHIVSDASVRYRPCPRCGQLMNRYNFGHISGVIIDRCPAHGVWFDREELRRIVDFIRAGGMGLSRQREAPEKSDAARERQAQARVDSLSDNSWGAGGGIDHLANVCRAIGHVIGWLLT
jgi:Zn-finger nucleic acid-binding protein